MKSDGRMSAMFRMMNGAHRTDLDGHISVVANRDGFTFGDQLQAPVGDVVFSKVNYDTPGTDSVEEYVELYNPSQVDVNLAGWLVTDGTKEVRRFVANNPRTNPADIDLLVKAGSTPDLMQLSDPDPEIEVAQLDVLSRRGLWARRLARLR